jgi:DNA gyrase subunit A
MEKFPLSELQVNAILDMRLYQLTNLEVGKIEKEYIALIKKIEYLRSILASERKIREIIVQELNAIADKLGDERKTEIVASGAELKVEDLIADEAFLITISHGAYIKRVPATTYRQQRRGGKGVAGMETKEEDFVEHLFSASAHDYILFFTELGMVHWLKVYEIPQGSRQSRGKAIANLLRIPNNDRIAALLRVREFDEKRFIMMATEKGIVKKTSLTAFGNPRKGGILAIRVDKGDRVITVKLTEGHNDVLLVTHKGQSIRFGEQDVRDMGRVARGVRGIALKTDDRAVTMEIVDDSATLCMLCENGYGKRTKFTQFRRQSRGGKGIIAMKTTSKTGMVVGAITVRDGDEVMIITASGKMLRTAVKEISTIGRATQGVRVVSRGEGDRVTAIAKVIGESDEGEGAETTTE